MIELLVQLSEFVYTGELYSIHAILAPLYI